MENSKIVHEEPEYKSNFYEDINTRYSDLRQEFWKPFNENYKEPKFETEVQRKKEKKAANKVVKSHDIWKSEAYDKGDWKDWKYKSIYTVDYPEKYKDTLVFNPEIKTKDKTMRRTKISEYSNALHNKGVFINPRFLSC